MSAGIKIECPKCGWKPNGFKYWRCSCGHQWNTFDTRGKCPDCNTQWHDTYCPGCNKSSEHDAWYTVKVDDAIGDLLPSPDNNDPVLIRRKTIIENRLFSYGIESQIKFLPYLKFSEEDFQSPYEVGCRILILWAVSYLSYNQDEKKTIENWLRSSKLWDKVSKSEKKIFTDQFSEKALEAFSWRIEAVIVLCWAVNLLEELPGLDAKISDGDLDNIMLQLPIEQNPDLFLSGLSYRDKEEIFMENIVNEMITWNLRDNMLTGNAVALKIDAEISFERHYALNWVRRFSELDDWDETDTST